MLALHVKPFATGAATDRIRNLACGFFRCRGMSLAVFERSVVCSRRELAISLGGEFVFAMLLIWSLQEEQPQELSAPPG